MPATAKALSRVSPEARRNFWHDRARTAAISAHTNAFKINEDVVIPLERLADYSRGIEWINIEESTRNKIHIAEEVLDYLADERHLRVLGEEFEASDENRTILQAKVDLARQAVQQAKAALGADSAAASKHRPKHTPQLLMRARASHCCVPMTGCWTCCCGGIW